MYFEVKKVLLVLDVNGYAIHGKSKKTNFVTFFD